MFLPISMKGVVAGYAYLSADNSGNSADVWLKTPFDVVSGPTDYGFWDVDNSRFNVSIAGYYGVATQVAAYHTNGSAGGNTHCKTGIYKNGALVTDSDIGGRGGVSQPGSVMRIEAAPGDYFEGWTEYNEANGSGISQFEWRYDDGTNLEATNMIVTYLGPIA